MKKCAIIYSGGKDSHLAMLKASSSGAEISCLVNFDGGDRHAEYFNDFRKPEIIKAHARLLGIRSVIIETKPDFSVKNLSQTVTLVADAARETCGADTLISGKAHCRGGGRIDPWRKAAGKAGFGLDAPMIRFNLIYTTQLCLELGVRALITGVESKKVDYHLLGRELDREFLAYLSAEKRAGRAVDEGDLQTLVLESPAFAGRMIPLKLTPVQIGGQKLLNIEEFTVVRGRRRQSLFNRKVK
jgi:diphthamide synthase (EF-2-diphthine--ammonia ligase)